MPTEQEPGGGGLVSRFVCGISVAFYWPYGKKDIGLRIREGGFGRKVTQKSKEEVVEGEVVKKGKTKGEKRKS